MACRPTASSSAPLGRPTSWTPACFACGPESSRAHHHHAPPPCRLPPPVMVTLVALCTKIHARFAGPQPPPQAYAHDMHGAAGNSTLGCTGQAEELRFTASLSVPRTCTPTGTHTVVCDGTTKELVRYTAVGTGAGAGAGAGKESVQPPSSTQRAVARAMAAALLDFPSGSAPKSVTRTKLPVRCEPAAQARAAPTTVLTTLLLILVSFSRIVCRGPSWNPGDEYCTRISH